MAQTSTSAGGSVPPPDIFAAMPFWKGVPPNEVYDLVAHETETVYFQMGDVITKQETECERVYFIYSGQVRLERWRPGAVTQNNPRGLPVQVIEKIVEKGYLIGRFALTYNLPNTSTATALDPVAAVSFPSAAFERLIYRYPFLRGNLTPQGLINRLRTMPLFARVGLVALSYLAEEVKVHPPLEAGSPIYDAQKFPDELYLIKQGQVALSHPSQPNPGVWLGTGNAFGFPGSIGGSGGSTEYGHGAKTTARTELYSLPWPSIQRLAARYPHVANPKIQNVCLKAVENISVFKGLDPALKPRLAGYCSFQHIPQHHLIMQQGDIGDSMWVLLEGSRAVLSALDNSGSPLPPVPVDGLVYFGESALVATRSVSSTIESEPGSLWLRFHWRDFASFVSNEKGPSIRDKLKVRLPDELAAVGSDKEYSWLSTGEQLISLTRRHWLSLLHKMRLSLSGLVVTLAVAAGLQLSGISPWWAIWLLGLPSLLAMIWGVLDHLNDFFIVTNQRVIQQEKVILTSEYRREALLEQVQNVGVRTSFWGKFFGYGIISVATAGSKGSIDFDFVPEPAGLQASIFRLTAERKARYRAESRLEIQTALEKRLGLVVELPSRVLAGGPRRMSTDDKSLPWQQRLWRYLFTDHQVQWISTERIVWHKHWFVLARQVVPLAVLALGLLLLMVGGFLFDFYQKLDLAFSQTLVGLEFILAFILLILLAAIAWVTADWWNDTYELTHDSIIDIEKLPLFLAEERKEARLSEIQDIRLNISSPLEMILNYGDITVETAATQGAFTFHHVPNPRAVKEEINRRLIEWRRNDERRKARDQMKDLPDWFEMYRRLEAGRGPTRVVLDNDTPKEVKGLS